MVSVDTVSRDNPAVSAWPMYLHLLQLVLHSASCTFTRTDAGNSTLNFEIGRQGGTTEWDGSIQDFRVYKGVAKYTANFTPPPAILG